MTTYSATRPVARVEVEQHPHHFANVIAAMTDDLRRQIKAAGKRPKGSPRVSMKWARREGSGWRRCLKRNATARVVTMTWTGV